MKIKTLLATVAAASLCAGIAQAQVPNPGTVYSLHTAANGACPPLDWHLVTGADGALSGMVSWDGMKGLAQAEGKIATDRTIAMTAKEVAGAHVGLIATITGKAYTDGWLLLNIKATNVDCSNVKVPLWRSEGTVQ